MAGDFDLTGRAVIVTGGNGGIGLGMAKALARAGCAVSIWGRNPEKNRAAIAELAPCGAPVEARTCDVTDRAAIEDAFTGTLRAFGRVDGCFANAGVGATGRQAFVDRADDDWRRMFAINLEGVFHVFQVALRHMIRRAESGDRFGRLVATSSLASLFAMPRGEHYADQGGAERAGPRARGRARALWHYRQCDPPRLDRHRDDCEPHAQREVCRQRDATDSDATLRRPKGFRWHRRLSDERALVLSHRRLPRDRRRLQRLLNEFS